jgi:hypothetical protein
MRFVLDLLNGIKPASFQFQCHFWKYEKVTGYQIRGVRWVGDGSHYVYRQKQLGEDGSVRRGFVMVKQPGMFSPKFEGDVFARFLAVAAQLRSRTRNSQFGLFGPVLRATRFAV